ncbi:hypothetical protein ACFY30_18420 [Streptomyces sp. NPDC000345]|uniref:hypothetical protein n=1 Tax=Streptomyces sp. NPDC000345 TaxID=3364537 RepID=UPI003687A48A
MVGAVAAIGSVAFTGVATYYSAVIAEQQLKQAQEDNELKEREQATRVGFWDQPSPDGRYREIHLANGSPDPVNGLEAMVFLRHEGSYTLYVGSVPPCSETVLRVDDLLIERGEDRKPFRLAQADEWHVASVEFADSAGQSWLRTTSFLGKKETVRDLPDVVGQVSPTQNGTLVALGTCAAS